MDGVLDDAHEMREQTIYARRGQFMFSAILRWCARLKKLMDAMVIRMKSKTHLVDLTQRDDPLARRSAKSNRSFEELHLPVHDLKIKVKRHWKPPDPVPCVDVKKSERICMYVVCGKRKAPSGTIQAYCHPGLRDMPSNLTAGAAIPQYALQQVSQLVTTRGCNGESHGSHDRDPFDNFGNHAGLHWRKNYSRRRSTPGTPAVADFLIDLYISESDIPR